MAAPEYIELHARSAFSFLRGACVPEDYVALAAAYGQSAMTLTDIDGVAGVPRFHLSARSAGIRFVC